MRYALWFLLAIVLITGCQNSKFERDFDCDTPVQFTNTKTYKDVLSHFKVDVPNNWKTKLYYDEYQSTLYTADTTKQLSESYIIDVTWRQGELVFDADFEERVAANVSNEHNLIPVKSGRGEFLGKPSYYHISTGKNATMNWHHLQVYVQSGTDDYYLLTSKIYGSDFVNERICASFGLFKTISFLTK